MRDQAVETVAFLKREEEEGDENPHNGGEDQQINSRFDDAFALAAKDAVPNDGRVIVECIGFDALRRRSCRARR